MTTIKATCNLDALVAEVGKTYRAWSNYRSMYGTSSHLWHAFEVAVADYQTAALADLDARAAESK